MKYRVGFARLFALLFFGLVVSVNFGAAQVMDLTGKWDVTVTGINGEDRYSWELIKDKATVSADYNAWGITRTLDKTTNSAKQPLVGQSERGGSIEFRDGRFFYKQGSGMFVQSATCIATTVTLSCKDGSETIGLANGREFPITISGTRVGGPVQQPTPTPPPADDVLAFYRQVCQPGYRIAVIGPSEDRHRAFGEYPSRRPQETRTAMLQLKSEGIHVPARLWENSFGVDNATYYNGMVTALTDKLGDKDFLVRWFVHYQRWLAWEAKRGPERDQQLKDATVWATLSGLSFWGAWWAPVAYDAKEIVFGLFGRDTRRVASAASSYYVSDAPFEKLVEFRDTEEFFKRVSKTRTVVGGSLVFIYFEKERFERLWFNEVPNQGNFDEMEKQLPGYRTDFEEKLKKAAAQRTVLETMLKYVEQTRGKYPGLKDEDWWLGRSAFSANGALFRRHFDSKKGVWPEEKIKDLELACIVLYVMADEPLLFTDKNQLARTMEAEESMEKARDLYKLTYYWLGYNGDPPVSNTVGQ